jgi:AbiV family abortive infection protein
VSSKKNRGYQLTSMLLRGFRKAAVDNARELQYEAALLLQYNHFSRAHFLAVTCIEEVGKSVQAFDALGRNVRDPAISTRVKLNFDDYAKKMTAAVFPWLLLEPDRRDEVMAFIDSLIDARRTSSPALQMGIDPHSAKIIVPSQMIKANAARTCVRMAQTIFEFAAPHVMESPPKIRTKVEDEFFAMKPQVLVSLTNNADFWQYYISCMKTGDSAFEAAVAEYSRKYYAKNAKFKDEGGQEQLGSA